MTIDAQRCLKVAFFQALCMHTVSGGLELRFMAGATVFIYFHAHRTRAGVGQISNNFGVHISLTVAGVAGDLFGIVVWVSADGLVTCLAA
jgi:hypothetical protein